jgi:hypothetical protein
MSDVNEVKAVVPTTYVQMLEPFAATIGVSARQEQAQRSSTSLRQD